ncbi:MAG: DUF3892 domain-containing protein [Bacilli bacterium]|nr:DUF3892 domain-containing protein [Bacilli bacterium]
MIKVTKIRMKQYSANSMKLEEIKDLKLEGDLNNPGWFSKESIHDYIKNNNGVVNVNIYPYPKLVAVTTATDRYVRSTPNRYGFDNLLELPRE